MFVFVIWIQEWSPCDSYLHRNGSIRFCWTFGFLYNRIVVCTPRRGLHGRSYIAKVGGKSFRKIFKLYYHHQLQLWSRILLMKTIFINRYSTLDLDEIEGLREIEADAYSYFNGQLHANRIWNGWVSCWKLFFLYSWFLSVLVREESAKYCQAFHFLSQFTVSRTLFMQSCLWNRSDTYSTSVLLLNV